MKAVLQEREASAQRISALKESLRFQEKPHGTRVRYMGGCRCMLCRAANSRYETDRAACRRAGFSNRLVPPERALNHVRELQARGVGWKPIAAAASISRTVMSRLVTGGASQLRQETEDRILSVDNGARAGGSLVPAAGAWKILDALIADGYTRRQLAEWMGLKNGAIQFRRDFIAYRNQVRVEKLWRMLQAGRLERGDAA